MIWSHINLPQLKQFYNNNGYVHIKQILNTKMKNDLIKYVNTIESTNQYFNKNNTNYLNQYEYSNTKKVLCRTEYIIDNHKPMKHILTQGLIPGIASTIHNTNITLYKEKINYKYFNTGSYQPHQDITAYPNSHNHITCMIPLCDTSKLNGCIEFSPVKDKTIYEHNNGVIQNNENLDFIAHPTEFGDILLFNSYVPHMSGVNKLNTPRRVLYITYNDLREGNLRNSYYKHKMSTLKKTNQISLINHYNGNIIKNKTQKKSEVNKTQNKTQKKSEVNKTQNIEENIEENKKNVIDNILKLYLLHGNKNYDPHITHLEHAFQTTQLAKNNNETLEFQLSCFLHDIGHLLLDEHNSNNNFLVKNLKHETVAFHYLNKHFSNFITYPIMYHVLAKRYLCTIDNNYFNSLSQASQQSFIIQDGYLDKFSLQLINNKIKHSVHFSNAIKLRIYEDLSKSQKINIDIDLNYIKNLLIKSM